MVVDEQVIRDIQKINVCEDKSWHSGQFPQMTSDQIVKLQYFLYKNLKDTIIALKGNADFNDVAINNLVFALMKKAEK